MSVTGIIQKGGRFLICKRGPDEKAFPNKWCVPGGKVEKQHFINDPKDTRDHWIDIFEKVLKKEIAEEVCLSIKNIEYVSSLVFIRPNGFPTIIVSLCAEYADGEVRIDGKELVDYAWVDLVEAKKFDLIENIYEQIERVDQRRMG